MARKETDLIEFLDSLGIYIGIIPDPDGITWLIEVCGVPLMDIAYSRAEAEKIAIAEAMRVLATTTK